MKNCMLILMAATLFFAESVAQRIDGSTAADFNAYTKVDPPSLYRDRDDLGTTATAQFQIIYDSQFPLGAIRNAIDTAGIIWSYLINSGAPVRVVIVKQRLAGFLASTTPHIFKRSSDTVWYPRALAKAKGWVSSQSDTDMVVVVDSSYIDRDLFHYGCDGNTPTGKYDLLSVVMHEIAHGLGFFKSFTVDSAIQFGRKGYLPQRYGGTFDLNCINGSRKAFAWPESLLWKFPDSSAILGQFLKSQNVYFGSDHSWEMSHGTRAPKLFAPPNYRSGSSISHLDSLTYHYGDPNSMMIYSRAKAEAVHSPGEVGLAVLKDVGWTINRLITFTRPLANQRVVRGDSIELVWSDNEGNPTIADLMKRTLSGTYTFAADLGYVSSILGLNPPKKLQIPSNADSGTYKIKFRNPFGQGYGETFAFEVTTTGQVDKPVLFPPGNTYFNAINVSATCPNGTIRFDTTGAEPTMSSPIYPSSGLNLTASKRIRAKGFATNLAPSQEANENYFIRYGAGATTGRIQCSFKIEAVQHSGGYTFGSSGSDPYVGTRSSVGNLQSPIARTFIVWDGNLPSYIVADSVTSVTLEVFASTNPMALPVRLVLTSGNTQDPNALWNSVGSTNIEGNVPLDFSNSYAAGPLVDAVKQSLRGNHSLQIAVVSNSEAQPNTYLQVDRSEGRRGYITITYNAQTLRIAQVDSTGFSFGQWAQWESNQWRSHPDTTMPRPTSAMTFTLKADTNYKPSTTQKYNRWLRSDGQDSIINHTNLPVSTSTASVLANFKPSKAATIQAQLIEGGNPGGTINFKDPWLIDDADSKGPKNRGVNAIWRNGILSPFKPETSATYKGVFLDENPNWLPDKPNYSVGAPSQQTFGTTPGVFVGWSGNADSVSFKNANSDTTGVVFKKAGATATARYKAHLRSSSSSVTAPTTQRKIIRDVNGNYHMVYESGNQILVHTFHQSGRHMVE